jgi:F-type H+-transporting ATPase subunit delta
LLKNRLVARHYALAFYPLVESKFQETIEILEGVSRVLEEAQGLGSFLNHPLFKIEDKEAILFRIPGVEASPEVSRMLTFLIEKKRLDLLQDILDELHKVRFEKELIEEVVIKSAYPLSSEEKAALIERIASVSGKKVAPQFLIEEGLIAGLVIKNGNEIIDGSFKSILDAFREQLMGHN